MNQHFSEKLSHLLQESEFIRSMRQLEDAHAPSRLFADSVRELSSEEIGLLVAQGNLSPDWPKVRVARGFLTDFIRNSSFHGQCVLGVFSGAPREIAQGVYLPDGIYDSTVVSCEIGNGCCIRDCGLIANYCIRTDVVIFRTGSISVTSGCTFGNGVVIRVGMETGGREVVSCAEIDVKIAEQVALHRQDKVIQDTYNDFTRRYLKCITGDFGIIEAHACIRNSTEIKNTYIGNSARIDGVSLIDNCTILSGPEEPTEISHGAFVKNSCVQWGCKITSMAIVSDSIVTEHSHVERHGKVTASIIGPNTGIAEGEVTSCLIGPFVGFHHQALLIAALWPEGKGNVAYGANVGSNHTSRAPDQEIFCGEGVFFGLGVNIKFPADFSNAPYSLFATGVSTLPQKIEFPFSLVQDLSVTFPGVSPAYNEIVPAWVLSDNIYMLLRNEGKFKKRNKAKKTDFELTVFRPDIIDKMVAARNRLASITQTKTAYTDKDIPGIGKNVLREERRCTAIDAYSFYIEYYCLLGLRDRINEISHSKKADIPSIYKEESDSVVWEHQRGLLLKEGLEKLSVKENLSRLISILEKIAKDALYTKEKDDQRGSAIIPLYEKTYKKAAEDSFIMEITRENSEAAQKIQEIISLL